MLSPQDENLIIDYIFSALDDSEESAVSVRLTKDAEFCRFYRKILKSLRPILSCRMEAAEDRKTRQESEGLASRTMNFVRSSGAISSSFPSGTQKTVMNPTRELAADTLAETRVADRRKQDVVECVPET